MPCQLLSVDLEPLLCLWPVGGFIVELGVSRCGNCIAWEERLTWTRTLEVKKKKRFCFIYMLL